LDQQDTLLSTVNVARKLSRNWTMLARNYYLGTNNHGAKVNGWQDRFQLGLAYRPVEHNNFDALGKLEYKVEHDINGESEYRKAMVGAAQVNYHPSRPWWLSGRIAGKSVNEQFPISEGGVMDSYKAYLVSGRVIYDITEKIDLGLNASLMSGKALNQDGRSVQKGLGLEVGYAMTSNVWTSLGYNFTGYTDKDLSSDYTARGVYLRLRYKFDQDLFQSNNPYINNTLERTVSDRP
jgi:opacity protein-like surface antigen